MSIKLRLSQALAAWGTAAFEPTLKGELEQLGAPRLVGAVGAGGGIVAESRATVRVLHCTESGSQIEVRAGVFHEEIVAGCSCGDDPVPLSTYAEVQVCIDKKTAEATFQSPPPEEKMA